LAKAHARVLNLFQTRSPFKVVQYFVALIDAGPRFLCASKGDRVLAISYHSTVEEP